MISGIVQLTIPAREEMLLVARMTLSGVCARCGFTLEGVEDARIAADEACYLLMRVTRGNVCADQLRLTCDIIDEKLVITFELIRSNNHDNDAFTANTDPERLALSKSILETLVASADLAADERGVHTIRLTLNGPFVGEA